MPPAQYQKSFVLTVAESKRLIARALKRHPAVVKALNQGVVAVAKGTTNAYVYQELGEEGIDLTKYCLGVTVPAGSEARTSGDVPDLILREGGRVEDATVKEYIHEMGPGDVFIKGANAINYERRQAGILIGHPTGGTIGATLGTIISRRITLLMPVGLEKNIPGDLHQIHRDMVSVGPNGSGPMLWPVDGTIFTEIEAIETITGCRSYLVGAGGAAGAEGAVWLSVHGTVDQVDRAAGAIADIRGEPPLFP